MAKDCRIELVDNMSVVSVIGNFEKGTNGLNGQTVKTIIVADELRRAFGNDQVVTFDTTGGITTLFKAPYIAWRALCKSKDVVILPAHNSLRVFVPLLVLLQCFFRHRRVHYVVIGGWLPTFLKNRPLLRRALHSIYRIYAETHRMQRDLEKLGYADNVTYMPNCKPLRIVTEAELITEFAEPYRLCTFSRVWSQKGIGDAVEAVKSVNENLGRNAYSLDIYGMVDGEEQEWFADLQKTFPKYVRYGGTVPYDKSVEVLKDYFALLFPTKCYTEGIPGTIIDAYAAGLPVISSLYLNFDEIIDEGVTGLGYEFGNNEALISLLKDIAEHPQRVIEMKKNCVKKAKMFLPDEVVKVVVDRIVKVNSKMVEYNKKYKRDSKPLGQGGAAIVYGCTRLRDSQRLAMKLLKNKNNANKVARFKREIETVCDIKSKGVEDGIIPIIEYDMDCLWYVMPLSKCVKDIIDDFEKKQRSANPVTTYQDQILTFFVDGFIHIADTLRKIHSLGYIHRDIKPDNLYVFNGKFCLGDFGIVGSLNVTSNLTDNHDRLGAWNTISPEVLRNAKSATEKSDVYSLAKSLWMCLTLNLKGFDGRYDFNASSMSLHDVPHLQNAYLLDIDELLKDATQEDPNLRPTMQEFAERLRMWKRANKNLYIRNKKEWTFIYKSLFNGIHLSMVSIEGREDIAKTLHLLARYTHLNYTMMPCRGGLTFKDACVAPEEGCIYLDFGFTFICKPKRIVYRGFINETWNYFYLELDNISPILDKNAMEEELVEDVPAHYVDCKYSVYGVYDYDTGEKFPKGWKLVTRVCKGAFLLVSKIGFYNSITPTTDGRHSSFAEADFYEYYLGIKREVEEAKMKNKNIDEVRKKYWQFPFIEQQETLEDIVSQSNDVTLNIDELDFSDLLDNEGESSVRYSFSFNMLEFRNPLDSYSENYLCNDGKIRALPNNDENIFFAHDKDVALLLAQNIKKRIADTYKSKGGDMDTPPMFVNIHALMDKAPKHIFTFHELENAIQQADDRVDNTVCVDANGHVVIVSEYDYHVHPVSYSTFGAFKNYVGKYCGSKAMAENIIKDLRSLFLKYLETGAEARYTEDYDDRDINEIKKRTEDLIREYAEGKKKLPTV